MFIDFLFTFDNEHNHMTRVQQQSLNFMGLAGEQVNKVCLFLVHENHLILIVRHHAKDNTVSIEPAGGKIDPKPNGDMETHGEALIREAHQELGVVIRPQYMMAVEMHPHTGKPVAYYSCEHVSGTPYNKAEDEHLGVIKVDIHKIDSYEDLELIALNMAQKIIAESHTGEEIVLPIKFRVPKNPVMNFIQQSREEPGAAFTDIPEENFRQTPKPA